MAVLCGGSCRAEFGTNRLLKDISFCVCPIARVPATPSLLYSHFLSHSTEVFFSSFPPSNLTFQFSFFLLFNLLSSPSTQVIWTQYLSPDYALFIALAIIKRERDELYQPNNDFSDILQVRLYYAKHLSMCLLFAAILILLL